MSKLPIFEHFSYCRESQAKTQMIFQAKTQAIFFLLNWVPEAAGVVALASDVVVDAQALGHGHEVLYSPGQRQFPPQMCQHCEWRVHVELAPRDKVCGEECDDEQQRDRCGRKATGYAASGMLIHFWQTVLSIFLYEIVLLESKQVHGAPVHAHCARPEAEMHKK